MAHGCAPEVKHAHRAVCRYGCKDAHAAPGNVVHLQNGTAEGRRHEAGAAKDKEVEVHRCTRHPRREPSE